MSATEGKKEVGQGETTFGATFGAMVLKWVLLCRVFLDCIVPLKPRENVDSSGDKASLTHRTGCLLCAGAPCLAHRSWLCQPVCAPHR